MRRYVVLFTSGDFRLPMYSGLQKTTHRVGPANLTDAAPEEDLHRLFNGSFPTRNGAFAILMGEQGPMFLRDTLYTPLELDGAPLNEASLEYAPLEIPSEHELKIGSLTLHVSIQYAD
jgi:hypothetical protein